MKVDVGESKGESRRKFGRKMKESFGENQRRSWRRQMIKKERTSFMNMKDRTWRMAPWIRDKKNQR